MKKARRLVNLDISEISSVDVGAGRGVRVMLMKAANANRRIDHMQTDQTIFKGLSGMVPLNIAKAAHAAVAAGEMSEMRFSEVMKTLALSLFPDAPNEGVALAKLFETAVGKALLAPRTGLSFAQNYELVKREGNDPTPHRARPGEEDPPAEGTPEAAHEQLSEMARERMKKHPEQSFQQHYTAAMTDSEEGRQLARRVNGGSLQKNA